MLTLIGANLIAVAIAGSIENLRQRNWKLCAAMNALAFIGMALVYATTH